MELFFKFKASPNDKQKYEMHIIEKDNRLLILSNLSENKGKLLSIDKSELLMSDLLSLNIKDWLNDYTPSDYINRDGSYFEVKFINDDLEMLSKGYDHYPDNFLDLVRILKPYRTYFSTIEYFYHKNLNSKQEIVTDFKLPEIKQENTLTKKDVLKVISVGSSSSGNSVIFKFSDLTFMVDAGITFPSAYETYLNDLKACFITHTHIDHIKYLNKIKAPIYTHNQASFYLNNYKDIETNALRFDSKKNIINDLYVTMFKTSHDSHGSAGFIFEKNGLKIGYLTDSGIVDEKMLENLKGSDLVIIEANHDIEMLNNGPYPYFLKKRILSDEGHLSNDTCAKICQILASNNTKHFLLAHLSEENNLPELALKTIQDSLKAYDVTIDVLPYRDAKEFIYEVDLIEEITEQVIDNNSLDSFVTYDFETSGLDSNHDCIIEIGACKVIDGIISETQEFKFQQLIKPYNGKTKISNFITNFTGITNEMLNTDGQDIKEALFAFKEFIGDYKLVGYNSDTFDSRFLNKACALTDIDINNEQLDLIKYARRFKKEKGLYGAKLVDMADYFNISNPNAHRAYNDALTTAKLYFELKKYLDFD